MDRELGNKAWQGRAARWAGVALAAALVAGLAACGGPDTAKLLAQARASLAKKDVDAARIHLKGVLQKSPDNGEARFLLGQLLLDSGDVAGAEVELRRALELQHPEQQVLPALASALLGQNKAALTLQQFGNAKLADSAAQARLQTTLAMAEASTGNIDAAGNRLDGALRDLPGHTPALLLRARLAAARGDQADALAQVKALLSKQPDLAEAWQLQGDLLLRAPAGQPAPPAAPAMAAYQEALTRQPANAAVHAAIIGLHLAANDVAAATTQWQAMQKAAPQNAQTLFFEAVLAAQKGDHKRTRELTQTLLRNAPNNLQVLLLAAQAELQLNAVAQAEAHLGKAVQLAPQAPGPRRQLAQAQLRGGQADKALATLAPLLGDKADADTLALAAQAQMMKGDTTAADASFARAARLKPDDLRVRTAMALSSAAKGKGPAALAELRAVAAADKGTTADLALVNLLVRGNDLPGALKAVENLAAKLPDDALPDQLRGRIALQRKDLPGARQHFEAALAKNADYLPALAGLAALDLNDKQTDTAKARFEAALQRNPKNAGAMLALAELAARSGGKADEVAQWLNKAVAADPADAAARVLLVDQLLTTNQTKAAQDAAQAGLVALPDNTELLDRLGRAQLVLGATQQAILTFNQLATAAPQSALPHLRLADAHTAARNTTAAAAAVRRAGELAPDQPLVQQAQVLMALQENRFDQALTIARKVQAQRPDDAAGHSMEGDVELRRKNWDAAATALRKAVARHQAGDAPQRLHVALLAGKKNAEADAMAQDWRQKHPQDMAFVLHLGDQALATNRSAEAEALYQQVIEKQPANVLALNNLAYLMATQKKPGAVALAERALLGAPKAPAVMDTLALALAAEQQVKRAVDMQKQAVAAAPDNHNFRFQLAKLMVQAGDKSTARGELSALAALGNKFPRQTEVADLIKTIDQ
ncbi:MAG: PEP-CTERM system TPR-repeat protein PrsT [Aquabacterium sp.]|nr:PEP-CTERM system TPR-repeat protein PrsT [Aquabacterium sp.]